MLLQEGAKTDFAQEIAEITEGIKPDTKLRITKISIKHLTRFSRPVVLVLELVLVLEMG